MGSIVNWPFVPEMSMAFVSSCIGGNEYLSRAIQGILIANYYMLLKGCGPRQSESNNEPLFKCWQFYLAGVQMGILGTR